MSDVVPYQPPEPGTEVWLNDPWTGQQLSGISWDEASDPRLDPSKVQVMLELQRVLSQTPTQHVQPSARAINSLIANYENRLMSSRTALAQLGVLPIVADNPDDPLDDEDHNIVGQVIAFTHTKRARQWLVMALLLTVSTCLFFATPPFNYIGFIAWVVLVFQLRESK